MVGRKGGDRASGEDAEQQDENQNSLPRGPQPSIFNGLLRLLLHQTFRLLLRSLLSLAYISILACIENGQIQPTIDRDAACLP